MALVYAGIRVTDLERSFAFYTTLLGLKLAKRGSMTHGGLWVQLEDPETHQKIELNWYPPGSPYATPFSVGEGLDHLGFKVQDARVEFARLVAAGATVAIEPWKEGPGEYVGYVKDPDGNWIEVFSYDPTAV